MEVLIEREMRVQLLSATAFGLLFMNQHQNWVQGQWNRMSETDRINWHNEIVRGQQYLLDL